MYLKEIDIQGFKSFAEKTKVVFDTGVTAIVGPNGSGKSNVTESLRWALGESSAKSLRGGKMSDVIFAGTQNRSPLNSAQVRVVLDNSDHYIVDRGEEIIVERRVYRNGDSDYLIDRKKVRLRDIHELFMDTGLGRDSFSVISQGRVESIFNSKPEERRAIFEEAAGVLKYKTRKKETQSRLTQTQDNLDRLEDIIHELQTQLIPLEKQAKTAKRFLELDEMRKELGLDVLIYDITEQQSLLTQSQAQLAKAKEELQQYYQQRSRLESENQTLKERRQHLTQKLSQEQDTLRQLTALVSDLEGKIRLTQLQEQQEKEQVQLNQQQLKTTQEALHVTQGELLNHQTQEKELQQQKEALQGDLKQNQLAIAQYAEDPEQVLEGLRDRYVQLMQDEARLTNQLTSLKAQEEQENQKRHQDIEAIAQYQAEERHLRDQKAEADQAHQTAQDQVEKLLKRYKEVELTANQQQKAYQIAQEAMFDQMDTLKSLKARKSSLENILTSHSNYYAGVRAVMQASDQLTGLIGPVSEHVSFDATYTGALEVAMQASSQHIIVEDEESAKQAISHLKRTKSGRATFLPLTTIRPRQLSERHLQILSSMNGFIGVADQLVQHDERLRPVFSNLLGATVLFETVDEANQAAKRVSCAI